MSFMLGTAMILGVNNVYGMKKSTHVRDDGSGFEKVFALNRRIEEVSERVGEDLKNHFNNVRIIFVGPSGSGKSTLRNVLQNIALVYRRKYGRIVVETSDEKCMGKSGIGHGREAKTSDPVLCVDSSLNLLYCDCPGFFDNRGKMPQEQEYVNLYAIKMLFKSPNKIKILLVVRDADISNRAESFDRVLSRLDAVFPDKSKLEESLALVVTGGDRDAELSDYTEGWRNNLDKEDSIYNKYIKFFIQNPERVFLFPKGKNEAIVDFEGKESLIKFLSNSEYAKDLEFKAIPDNNMMAYVREIEDTLKESLRCLTEKFGTAMNNVLLKNTFDVSKLNGLRNLLKDVEEDKDGDITRFLKILSNPYVKDMLSDGGKLDIKDLLEESDNLSNAIYCLRTLGSLDSESFKSVIRQFAADAIINVDSIIHNLEEMEFREEAFREAKEASDREFKKEIQRLTEQGKVSAEEIKKMKEKYEEEKNESERRHVKEMNIEKEKHKEQSEYMYRKLSEDFSQKMLYAVHEIQNRQGIFGSLGQVIDEVLGLALKSFFS